VTKLDLARYGMWDVNMSEEGASRGEIFVVDDDPSVGETLWAILRRNGYEVTCFAEGQSFLAATRAREPACVLLDVNLPGQSGLDILKNLNGEHYPVPILMISGVGDIPMAVEAIRYGALDFIENRSVQVRFPPPCKRRSRGPHGVVTMWGTECRPSLPVANH
jgi:ActR/RegA family two-component response regulator